MVAEALKFMRAHHSGPFLAVIWFGSPHYPWTASDEDRRGLPSGKRERLANFLGEIVALDRSVGALRKGLRNMGIEKNTLVWYCSDNGGLPDDPDAVGNLRGHKGSLYEGGLRVPCIIEWPGRVKPMITDFPASTMDIMPTIVDLLRLPNDSQLAVHDGESIAALFDGGTPKRTRLIPFTSKGSAFIDGDYKLLNAGSSRNADWKLYDLARDPGESTDVSAAHAERFERMKADAEAMLRSVASSAEGKDYPEGKVIQPPRHEKWPDMEAYKPYLKTFEQHKEHN
jgi:arylsulfatase A-like enzyme